VESAASADDAVADDASADDALESIESRESPDALSWLRTARVTATASPVMLPDVCSPPRYCATTSQVALLMRVSYM
jgi:hypothetical protein